MPPKLKLLAAILSVVTITWPCESLRAQKNYNGPPLFIDVNAIKLEMKKLNGEGQFTTQYSWMLTGTGPEKTELFFHPQDQWHSQLLYQIFNPVCLDDNGVTDQLGTHKIIPSPFVSTGINDFSLEIRRYRPPYVTLESRLQIYRRNTARHRKSRTQRFFSGSNHSIVVAHRPQLRTVKSRRV